MKPRWKTAFALIKTKIMTVQAILFFSLVYIFILPLIWLVFKIQKQPLKKLRWSPWQLGAKTLEDIKKQY